MAIFAETSAHTITMEFFAFVAHMFLCTAVVWLGFDVAWARVAGPNSSPADLGAFVLIIMTFVTPLVGLTVGIKPMGDAFSHDAAIHLVLLWGATTLNSGYVSFECGTWQPNTNGTLISNTFENQGSTTATKQPIVWRWAYSPTDPTMVAGWVLDIFVWALWLWLVAYVAKDFYFGMRQRPTYTAYTAWFWESEFLAYLDIFHLGTRRNSANQLTSRDINELFYATYFMFTTFLWGSLIGSSFYQLNLVASAGPYWGYEQFIAIASMSLVFILGGVASVVGFLVTISGGQFMGWFCYGLQCSDSLPMHEGSHFGQAVRHMVDDAVKKFRDREGDSASTAGA